MSWRLHWWSVPSRRASRPSGARAHSQLAFGVFVCEIEDCLRARAAKKVAGHSLHVLEHWGLAAL